MGAVVVSGRAEALTWPDVADRIDRELASPDAGVRKAAAGKLHSLTPGVATPLVLRALADSDVEVRIAASRAAMVGHIVAATDIVLSWLGERDVRLKISACEVAGAMPNARAIAALARALGDADAGVRTAAATALGGQSSPQAVAPLLGKLDDSSPLVRVQIAHALARLGDLRAVVPLVGKIQDSVPDVRQSVARALGELGDPRAAQPLVQELRDGSNEVRIATLRALGQLRADGAVDAISSLATDKNPLLRQAAAAALGRVGSAEAVRSLVNLLGAVDDATAGVDPSPVRDALVATGAAAVEPLRALLAVPSTTAAAASAAWVLGEMRSTVSAPEIIRAMRKGTLPVPAALHALAGTGSPDAVAIALEFVDDPSPAIRAEAFRAAALLLDPAHPDGRAVEPLAAALRGARLTVNERVQVASLLGRTGAPRAGHVLVGLLSLHDPELKLAALDALGALGPASADGPLLDQLDDPDPAVRLHAAVSLADAGGAHERDALISRLDGGAELDRSVTLTALGGILARAPSDAAIQSLSRTLALSEGPERDALILAIGRADAPAAMSTLRGLLRSANADDRRTLAAVLAARHARADSIPMLRALLADSDATVRAEAAWSIGEIGGPTELDVLTPLVRAPDVDPAVDATGAIGRLAARAGASDRAVAALCPLLGDPRSYVRANAAAGLALLPARCGDGSAERQMLADDVEPARLAAARAIARRPLGAMDSRALDRCATSDRSGAVARLCRQGAPTFSSSTHPVELYVASDATAEPRPGAPFVAEFADGILRASRTDRRGATFDAAAPQGDVSLTPIRTPNR
jgi:HEAT repeat protein